MKHLISTLDYSSSGMQESRKGGAQRKKLKVSASNFDYRKQDHSALAYTPTNSPLVDISIMARDLSKPNCVGVCSELKLFGGLIIAPVPISHLYAETAL